MAGIQAIPLQLVPPVLLTVHDRAAKGAIVGGWKALQAPASPHPDGLKLGSKHLGLAYLMQLGELMQVDVLQFWESQHTSFLRKYFSRGKT